MESNDLETPDITTPGSVVDKDRALQPVPQPEEPIVSPQEPVQTQERLATKPPKVTLPEDKPLPTFAVGGYRYSASPVKTEETDLSMRDGSVPMQASDLQADDIAMLAQGDQSMGASYVMSMRGQGPWTNPEEYTKGIDFIYGQEEAQATNALKYRTQNALALSRTFGISIQEAFDKEPQYLKMMYQGQDVSSETAWGRLKMEWDKAVSQNKIAILSFAQLHGDSSDYTARRIQELELGQPLHTRTEEISQLLMDPNVRNKFFIAMGGLPYMMAQQLPMWIEQGKVGIPMAVLGAAIAGPIGFSIAKAAGAGFLMGGGIYEVAMEAGSMWHEIKREADAKGIKLDQDMVRNTLMSTAAIISAIDMASFGNIAARGLKMPTKKLGVAVIKKQLIQGLAKDIAKESMIGFVEEGVTEAIQTAIGKMGQNFIAANAELESESGESLDIASLHEIMQESAVTLAMAGPIGFFMGGVTTSFTAARTYIRDSAVKAYHKGVNTIIERQLALTEERVKVDTQEADVDIGPKEMTGLDPDYDLMPTPEPMANLPSETRQVRVHKIKRVKPKDVGGPTALYAGPGIQDGEHTIMGSNENEDGTRTIYVRKGGETVMTPMTPAEAVSFLMIPQQTVTKHANKANSLAAEAILAEAHVTPAQHEIQSVNKLMKVRTLRNFDNHETMIIRDTDGTYVATANQGAALEMYNNGAEIIGYTNAEGEYDLAGGVKTVQALKWNDTFEITTEWDVPEGTVVKKQKKIGDEPGFFYYDEVVTQEQSIPVETADEIIEQELDEETEEEMTEENDAMTPEDVADEVEISGVGSKEVQIADDDIVKATGAEVYGKRPRGWRKHGRINFAGQTINTLTDIAVLFSLFRSPVIEQSHTIFLKDGKIVANNMISAGQTSSTPWGIGKGARKLHRLQSQIRRTGADEVYIVHNHPSGNPTPSDADTAISASLRALVPEYAGDYVLNHDTFVFTNKAGKSAEIAYEPQAPYDRGIVLESDEAVMRLASEAMKRGTAIMVAVGKEVRAVLTPTHQYNVKELKALMRHFQGYAAFIATTDKADYDYYADVGAEKGTNVVAMVSLIDEKTGGPIRNIGLTPDWQKKQLTSESFLWDDERLEPLLDNATDDPAGPVPNTVKKWRKFWYNLIRKYNITRPSGLSMVGSGTTSINVKADGSMIGVDARAVITEGVNTIELTIKGVGKEHTPYKVIATVAQGETGIEAHIAPNQEITEDQSAFAKKYLQKISEALYQEGIDWQLDDLDISEAAKEAISEYSQFKDLWKTLSILEVRKGHTLKEKIGTLAAELVTLAEQGLDGTKEYQAIKAILWEMAQSRVELEGMTSYGISNIKYRAASLARSRLTPGRLKVEIRAKIEGDDGYRVRLPLTKNEEIRLEKIKKMDPEKVQGSDSDLLKYSKLPGIDTLTFNQLTELEQSLELFDNLRLKATEMKFFGVTTSLEAVLRISLADVQKYRPEEIKELSPAAAAQNRSVWLKARDNIKNYLIDRQTQYFHLVEHIAGRNSIAYHALYRNLEMADRRTREMRQNLQDMFSESIMSQNINQKSMAKWHDSEITVGGRTWTNNQALEVYMNSLCPDNWDGIIQSGMYYTQKDGSRIHLHPDAVDFQAVADHMAADSMATGIATAYRVVYDALGRAVGQTYESMFGKEFEYFDNYYPKKVSQEFWDTGQADLNDMTLVEGDDKRISIAKSFTRDRTAEGAPLDLNVQGSSFTFAISLEQQTKFVQMELPFFQASKLLYDPAFKAAIVNSRGLGQQYWNLIESGLQDWAGRQQNIKGAWDEVFLFVRRQATRAGLGLNPFSALKAMVSWFYAMRYVDPRHASAALFRLARTGKADIEMLMAKSPVFRDRIINGALPEVNDILKGKAVKWAKEGLPQKGTKDYDTLIFSLITGIDKRTVTAVMMGAIDQAMDAFRDKAMTEDMKIALNFDESVLSNMSTEEHYAAAVTYAEYVLQRTQPDFRPQSRNQFQRGTSLERLASVFGSFVTITHNMVWDLAHRIRREGIDSVGVKEMAWTLTLMVAVSIGNEGIDAMKRALLERDQASTAEMLARMAFNNTFIIRDINQMVMSKFKYGEFAGHGGGDAYTRFLDQGITGVIATTKGLYDGDSDRWMAGIGQMAEALTSFAGLPVVVFGYGTEVVDKRIINK